MKRYGACGGDAISGTRTKNSRIGLIAAVRAIAAARTASWAFHASRAPAAKITILAITRGNSGRRRLARGARNRPPKAATAKRRARPMAIRIGRLKGRRQPQVQQAHRTASSTPNASMAAKIFCIEPPGARRSLLGRCQWSSAALADASASDFPFIEQPRADRSLQRADFGEHALAVGGRGVGVQHDIADIVVRFIILRGDVDRVPRQHFVQPAEHARQIALDLDETRAVGRAGNCTWGKLTAPIVGAAVAVVDELARDFAADALLRLLGRAADMRRQNDVLQALQRRNEPLGVRSLARPERRRSPRRAACLRAARRRAPQGRPPCRGCC